MCIHSSVRFPRCLAASLFFTSLPLSCVVKLNADIAALVQSSFRPPSSNQSVSTLRTINLTAHLLLSHVDSFVHPVLHLKQANQCIMCILVLDCGGMLSKFLTLDSILL